MGKKQVVVDRQWQMGFWAPNNVLRRNYTPVDQKIHYLLIQTPICQSIVGQLWWDLLICPIFVFLVIGDGVISTAKRCS